MPKKYEEPKSIKVLTPTKTYGGHTHFPKTPQTPVFKKRQNCNGDLHNDQTTEI